MQRSGGWLMATGASGLRAARTLLEQKIRERRETFEEFAEYAERFARERNEAGTLSVRHLQRLAAGRNPDRTPLGPLRPATSRLLERIFSMSVDDLLRPPTVSATPRTPTTAQPLRVAVAVVIKDTDVLVVCRRGDEGGGISWQFPAGVVKPGVAAKGVAVRETLAETGVNCRMTSNLGSRLHPITNVYCDYLLCEYLNGQCDNIDVVENISVAWVSTKQLLRYIPYDHIYPPILDAL